MARKLKVDYVTDTPEAAAKYVEQTAEDYRDWHEQEGSKTLAATLALREARHTGYLHIGPADQRPEGAITLAGFAGMFGVTRPATTFWSTLATARDLGFNPESAEWHCLMVGKAARRSDVSAAIKADGSNMTKVRAAMKADGWRTTKQSDGTFRSERITEQGKGPRTKKPGQTDGDADDAGSDGPTPVEPFKACASALASLAAGLKALTLNEKGKPVDSPEWDRIRSSIVDILKREDTLRGTGPAVRPARKRTAAKRTAA